MYYIRVRTKQDSVVELYSDAKNLFTVLLWIARCGKATVYTVGNGDSLVFPRHFGCANAEFPEWVGRLFTEREKR